LASTSLPVSTAEQEPDIDLGAVHAQLTAIDQRIAEAAEEHNGYLKELELPPV
jgi:type I restriction enzyme M protein